MLTAALCVLYYDLLHTTSREVLDEVVADLTRKTR
jgi:hypothetical protein